MLIPMPSPRGTNHESLFIRAPRRPAAAYDSSAGLNQHLGDQLLLFLRDKLSAADYTKLETLLEKESPNDDPVAPAMDARRGRQTQATVRSFNERYPEAARIGLVW